VLDILAKAAQPSFKLAEQPEQRLLAQAVHDNCES